MSSMGGRRHTQIGLDRLVRLTWLEQTALLILAGNDASATKLHLQEDLRDFFQTPAISIRGSLNKTITILLNVWAKGPPELKRFRIVGLDLLQHLPRKANIAVHWGMVMAVYPFWAGVASQVGRLMRLQGSTTAAQVQRRVREQYGERETVSRRARYVLRSFVDWGVLRETSAKGIYNAGLLLAVDDPRLLAWLVEASLHARANSAVPLKEILESPSLFPFRLKRMHADSLLAASSKIDILRHGLDENLVMLRK